MHCHRVWKTIGYLESFTNGRQNCWDTVINWSNFKEQNNLHPSPPLHSNLGCLFFPTGSSVEQWHNILCRGWGRESFILVFGSHPMWFLARAQTLKRQHHISIPRHKWPGTIVSPPPPPNPTKAGERLQFEQNGNVKEQQSMYRL